MPAVKHDYNFGAASTDSKGRLKLVDLALRVCEYARAVSYRAMNNPSENPEEALVRFICERFSADELSWLARFILTDEPRLLKSLPPFHKIPPMESAEAFIGLLGRHGYIDDEFFRALIAARKRFKKQIRAIWKTMLDESVRGRTGRAKAPEVSNRLRLELVIDIRDLSNERLDAILSAVRSLSGGAPVKIESATEGSTILVLRGWMLAIERLYERLIQEQPELAGLRIAAVELVPFEPRPTTATASSRAPSRRRDKSDSAPTPRASFVLEDFNLDAAERLLCETALKAAGDIIGAAQLLGITRHALKRRIVKHRIEWPLKDSAVELADGSLRDVSET